jgi:hypothetical protein
MLNNKYYDNKRRLAHYSLSWYFWEIIYGSNWLQSKRYKDFDFNVKLIEKNRIELIKNNKDSYIYNNSLFLELNNIKIKKEYKNTIDRYSYTPNAKMYWEKSSYNNSYKTNHEDFFRILNKLTNNNIFFKRKGKRLPHYGLFWLFFEFIYGEEWFRNNRNIKYDHRFINLNYRYQNNYFYNINKYGGIGSSSILEKDPYIFIDEYENIYLKGDQKNVIGINSTLKGNRIEIYNDIYERNMFTYQDFFSFIMFNCFFYYIFNLLYLFILFYYWYGPLGTLNSYSNKYVFIFP